jgi:hypothetical protein
MPLMSFGIATPLVVGRHLAWVTLAVTAFSPGTRAYLAKVPAVEPVPGDERRPQG